MSKLGSKENPLDLNVHTEEELDKVTQICHEEGWYFMVGVNSNEPKDLKDLNRKLMPGLETIVKEKKYSRNQSCPCGSGKKLKRCCIDLICQGCGELHFDDDDEQQDHDIRPNEPIWVNP